MDKRLHEAAVEGSITALHEILEEGRLVLDGILIGCLIHTPLHVAAFLGHVDFVREILNQRADLARVLDPRRWSPLHLASAQGHVEIVKQLLLVNPFMCTVLDGDGRNPLHLAAIEGRVEVLEDLVKASPHAARTRVDREETILHLCVKHNQLETLKLLLNRMKNPLFVRAIDGDGNTILHLAIADERFEIVNYLLTSGKVDVNIKNANGYTAVEILSQMQSQGNLHVQEWDTGNSLHVDAATLTPTDSPSSGTGDGSARHIGMPQSTPFTATQRRNVAYEQETTLPTADGRNPRLPSFTRIGSLKQSDWLAKIREALLVVASLSATLAFQAGVSPVGGVWQNDDSGVDSQGHPMTKVGKAIVAYSDSELYKAYLTASSICFFTSISTILLIISGLPFRRPVYTMILTVLILLSITSMAFTYAFAVIAVTPEKGIGPVRQSFYVVVPSWCGVAAFVLLGPMIARLIWRKLRSIEF